jgi:hypothetical protein
VPPDHQENSILLIDTVLRYHLSIEPDELDDWEWAGSYGYLLEILKAERQE